jgi:hypothetical protein
VNGGVANGSIPSTIAPGNYLLRHEIIALHLATALGGAEFYPGCIQLSVGGSQTGKATSSELVSIPGAYKDTDPGIFDPTVFDTDAPYTFPGPQIAAFVSGSAASSSSGSSGSSGSSASGTADGSSSGSSGSSTASATPAASTGSTKSCKLKKRAVNTTDETLLKVREARPYHVSRIMRRMAFGESTL